MFRTTLNRSTSYSTENVESKFLTVTQISSEAEEEKKNQTYLYVSKNENIVS